MNFEYQKAAFNEIYGFIPKGAMTFTAWHKRAQEARETVRKSKAAQDADIDSMRETWAQRVIDERRAAYDEAHAKIVKTAKENILNDLEKVIEAKSKLFSDAVGDPGDEAVRILTVLNMRQHLTAGDIAAAVTHLSSSLIALQSLAEIAERNGISFPKLPTQETFDANIDKIREFANNMVETIDNADPNYLQRLFWTTDFMGMIQQQADELDSPSFLQIDAKEIKTTANEPQPEVTTKLTLNGTEYIDTVAREFGTTVDAIQKANPGKDLVHTHDGDVITIPGALVHPETGNGHISEDSHDMTVDYNE